MQSLLLPSMAFRQVRGDIRSIYNKFIHHDVHITRAQTHKLIIQPCKTVTRRNYFSARPTSTWNGVMESVVKSEALSTINTSKRNMSNAMSNDDYEMEEDNVIKGDGGNVIKVQGLPWTSTAQEIADFFQACNIVNGPDGVHLTFDGSGRQTGVAYIQMASEEDVENALRKNKEYIQSKRYVEVYRARKTEMDMQLKVSREILDEAVVRLRGLPYQCSDKEIADFFSGLEIVPDGIITFPPNADPDRRTVFVKFSSRQEVDKALKKDKEMIRNRYIEIFRSSYKLLDQLDTSGNHMWRSTGGAGRTDKTHFRSRDRHDMGMGMRGGHQERGEFENRDDGSVRIFMRGLPFDSTYEDVEEFFLPLRPKNIEIEYNDVGYMTGRGDVIFNTLEEAQEAMKKHRGFMKRRYIELIMKPRRDRDDMNRIRSTIDYERQDY